MGYGIIELLWRGRTHWTMVIAGGMCFIIFSQVAKRYKTRSGLYKAAVCSVGVTAVELIFGIAFNLVLKMGIWDYSKMPFNFMGQICLLYTLLWGVLGYFFVPLAEMLNNKLDNGALT